MGQRRRRADLEPVSIDVANLDLRIPVAEAPGAPQVQTPAAKLPPRATRPSPTSRCCWRPAPRWSRGSRAGAARSGERERPRDGVRSRARSRAPGHAGPEVHQHTSTSPAKSERTWPDRRAQRVEQEGRSRVSSRSPHPLDRPAPVRAEQRELIAPRAARARPWHRAASAGAPCRATARAAAAAAARARTNNADPAPTRDRARTRTGRTGRGSSPRARARSAPPRGARARSRATTAAGGSAAASRRTGPRPG